MWGRELSECVFISRSEDETKKLGELIAGTVPEGTLIVLKGDLGCGKTALTRGIARGLGIPEDEISSPSFNIVHEYENLIHVDLYRLSSIEEAEDFGLYELLEDSRVKVVEWGEELLKEFPNAVLIECREENRKRVFKISDPTGKICEKINRIAEE